MSFTADSSTNNHHKIRVLLALWDLGGSKQEVNKGKVTRRIVPKGKKLADSQPLLDELLAEGAIEFSKKGFSMSAKGLEMLRQGLNSSDFTFPSQIGEKTANALLKWIREEGTLGTGAIAPAAVKGGESAIGSYDEFKQVALDVYDKLNRDYNLNDLVPIYRIRREIGDKVSRSQFNDWMMEMQANDILQLQGGSVEDSAPDKIEDSIRNELGNVRCYAKRLTS